VRAPQGTAGNRKAQERICALEALKAREAREAREGVRPLGLEHPLLALSTPCPTKIPGIP